MWAECRERALKKGVREALQAHKQAGKVLLIPPEEIDLGEPSTS